MSFFETPVGGTFFFIYDFFFCLVSTPAPTKDIKTLKDKHDEISSNDDKFKAKTNDEKHTTEVQEKMKRLNVTNDVKKDESDVIKQQSSTSGIGGKAVT